MQKKFIQGIPIFIFDRINEIKVLVSNVFKL